MTVINLKEKGVNVPLLLHSQKMEQKKTFTLRIRDEDGSFYNYVTSDLQWAKDNLDVVATR